MADLSIYTEAEIEALVIASGSARWELASSTFTDTLVAQMMAALQAGTLAAGPLPRATGHASPEEAAFTAFVSGVAADIATGTEGIARTLRAGASGAVEAAEAAGKLLKFLPIIGIGLVALIIFVKVR